MSKARQCRSAQEWASLVAEYEGGCEDEPSFCRRRGLSRHTFRKYRYGKRRQRDRAPSGRGGFREVTVTPQAGAGQITVCGTGGLRIEVPVSVGMAVVAELVRALTHGR